MGAVIERNGRILATGCNRIGYSKYLRGRPYPESIHAEQQAILQLLKQRRLDELAGATIYISRVGANGLPRLAMPCRICRLLIESVGLDRIVYTTNNGVKDESV